MQRAAVLRALASMGYEVREGWRQPGWNRAHCRAQANGVSLRRGTQRSRQGGVRAGVCGALSAGSRNAQRDIEVETSWCGEFARMREMLAEDGFNTRMLHAQAAGSVPLKVAESAVAQDVHRAAA